MSQKTRPLADSIVDRSGERSVTQQIYRNLKDRIIAGDLVPDTRMSEASLAEEFGVSRTPVREALKLLSNEGYVIIAPQLGSIVSRINLQDVMDATEVRAIMEPEVARRAALRGDSSLCNVLHTVISDMERAHAEKHYDEFLRADNVFHRTVWEATGNRRIVSVLESVLNVMERARLYDLMLMTDSHLQTILEHHQLVCEAICHGQAEKAYQEMMAHIENVRSHMVMVGRDAHPELEDAG